MSISNDENERYVEIKFGWELLKFTEAFMRKNEISHQEVVIQFIIPLIAYMEENFPEGKEISDILLRIKTIITNKASLPIEKFEEDWVHSLKKDSGGVFSIVYPLFFKRKR
jgi:hypothetical protein